MAGERWRKDGFVCLPISSSSALGVTVTLATSFFLLAQKSMTTPKTRSEKSDTTAETVAL